MTFRPAGRQQLFGVIQVNRSIPIGLVENSNCDRRTLTTEFKNGRNSVVELEHMCLEIRKFRSWLFLALFSGVFLGVADQCDAQRFGRLFNRQSRAVNRAPVFQDNYESLSLKAGPQDFDAVKRSTKSFFESLADRHNYDPRYHRDWDADSRYPKFIGGFHSSHFSNVGLPSGDIGFRGNGLYWTPW